MSKAKAVYVCQECGYSYAKWLGQCPSCGAWNTMQEEVAPSPASSKHHNRLPGGQQPQLVADVAPLPAQRLSTGLAEMDRVLGGGVVPGSVAIISGPPGIGKSTILAAVTGHMAAHGPVLYVSGEESAPQLKLRMDRLGVGQRSVYVVAETDMQRVEEHILALQPVFVVVDSIQTMCEPEISSAPGSVAQVRESAAHLVRVAKSCAIPVFIVGQVTKDATLAGPRVMEHLVDTVIFLSAGEAGGLRVMHVTKNRFGATREIAVFTMTDHGLQEMANPSQYLLDERAGATPGAAVVATAHGSRPLFLEVQGLVTEAPPGLPPRQVAVGIDRSRLGLVAAVLHRWTGCKLGFCNLFVSLSGGLEIDDPALDLGMAVALLSSRLGIAVPANVVWVGEITLAGQVRATPELAHLAAEAQRLGFTTVVAAKREIGALAETQAGCALRGVSGIQEVVKVLQALRG